MSDPSTDLAKVSLNDPARVSAVVQTISHAPALTLLRRAADALGIMAEQYRGDPYATGSALVHVDTLMRDLRMVVSDLKRWTNEAMTSKQLIIPDVGVLERAGEGTKNDWNDADTLRAVITWALAQGTTGAEMPEVLLRFCHIDYWRKTVLKEAGIDYGPERDDAGEIIEGTGLVQVTHGEPSVRVVSRND